MRKTSTLIGWILMVAGVALLAYGYYRYSSLQGSLGNALTKVFKGNSAKETQTIFMMIGGGVSALVGAYLSFVRR